MDIDKPTLNNAESTVNMIIPTGIENIGMSNIGGFFLTYIFLLLASLFFGFKYGFGICDSIKNENCTTYAIGAIFLIPLIMNIVIHLLISSSAYKKFEGTKTIRKTFGILEIVMSPVITGVFIFIYYIFYGFQNPGANVFLTIGPYFSILIFIGLIMDGVRRLKTPPSI